MSQLKNFVLPQEKEAVVYENTLRIIYSLLDINTNFVDVGVNYGQHFISASKRFKEENGGSCVGYEPSNDCFEYIKNLNLTSKIRKLGVSHKSGISKYIYVEGYDGAWSALEKVLPSTPKAKMTELEIQSVTLDEDLDGKLVDFIKIDIEGGEFNALLGAKNVIRKCNPLIVIEHGGAEIAKEFNYSYNDYINLFPKDYDVLGIDFKKYTKANFDIGMPWMQIAVPNRFKKYINLIMSICEHKKNQELILEDHFHEGISIINGTNKKNNNLDFFSIIKSGEKEIEIPISSKNKYFLP